MKSKLINKLILLLSCLFLLFILLFGVCFSFLFVQHANNVENSRLETKALSLSDAFSKNTPDGTLTTIYNNAALRLLNALNQNEIWLIDKNSLQITGSRSYPNLNTAQLSAAEMEDIQKIFSGQNIRTASFSKFINPEYTTVGVPVYDRYGQVQAALLLHDKVPTLKHSWYDGLPLILLCTFALYAICVLLLIYFSKRYILSLEVINTFIEKILNHNFASHIKTKSTDEIGQLAQNLNKLSTYLQDIEQNTKSREQSNYNLIVKTAYKLHTPLKELKSALISMTVKSNTSKTAGIEQKIPQMLKDVEKLQHITNNLLELSQLNNVDFNIKKSLLNLLDILKDSINSRQKIAADKQIKLQLELKLADSIILFSGDGNRLKQMFCETLDKALQIYPIKSTLHINVMEDEYHYFIYLKNNNNEISIRHLPDVFQQFAASVSDTKSDDVLLSSIELTIAQHLASLHNIKLNYIKQSDDYTTFEFIINK